MKKTRFIVASLVAMAAAWASIAATVSCSRMSADAAEAGAPHKLGANMNQQTLYVLSGFSADASAKTAIGNSVSGLEHTDLLNIDCQIVGPSASDAAGATVDVYLQKLVSTAPDVWVDFVHFPPVATGATKTYNIATNEFDAVPVLVGIGADDAGGVALDSGYMAHGHPGSTLRLVTVTGTNITAAASATCYIVGRTQN